MSDVEKAEADAQDEMRIVIRVWFDCSKEKRPSPAALGQRIAKIASQLPNGHREGA